MHRRVRPFDHTGISSTKRAQAELARRSHDLGERVKELQCLYAVSSTLHDSDDLDGALQNVVELLPAGWQHPEVACARIVVDAQEHRTPGWRSSRWVQRQPIRVGDRPVGELSVGYLEPRPGCEEGPFLTEERHLLEAIAERIAETLRRRQAENDLRVAQKMEAVGRLAGGIAHDFNNLLTAIGVHAEFLLEQLPPDEQNRVDAREIHRAAASAPALTRRLLAFSKREVHQPQEIDIDVHFRDTETMLRRLLGEDIDLVTNLHPGRVWTEGRHRPRAVDRLRDRESQWRRDSRR